MNDLTQGESRLGDTDSEAMSRECETGVAATGPNVQHAGTGGKAPEGSKKLTALGAFRERADVRLEGGRQPIARLGGEC